ncbi:hypothetical protein FVE85_3759 [Porphyridium purpureum]|uniref:CCHC-type domain-containing protein n=1 Tax=Porphyridium purpureum TaxID=35688 RepID=A0A5J4YLG4_PORPP|nr:hypothetical protein FVE85_3759 [Porphyridium purpureum]|eukprot:POR7913..scf249_10
MNALGLIGCAVQSALVSLIAHIESARDAWNVLQSVFQMSGAARRASLGRELHAMKLKTGQAINEYVEEAVRIRKEFIVAGISIDAQEMNQALFAGLQGEYAIAEHMALAGGAQALKNILPSLILAEVWINLKSEPRSAGEHGSGVALMAPSRQPRRHRRRLTCFRCRSEDHLIRECPHPPIIGAPSSSVHGPSHARLGLGPDAAIKSRNREIVLAEWPSRVRTRVHAPAEWHSLGEYLRKRRPR